MTTWTFVVLLHHQMTLINLKGIQNPAFNRRCCRYWSSCTFIEASSVYASPRCLQFWTSSGDIRPSHICAIKLLESRILEIVVNSPSAYFSRGLWMCVMYSRIFTCMCRWRLTMTSRGWEGLWRSKVRSYNQYSSKKNLSFQYCRWQLEHVTILVQDSRLDQSRKMFDDRFKLCNFPSFLTASWAPRGLMKRWRTASDFSLRSIICLNRDGSFYNKNSVGISGEDFSITWISKGSQAESSSILHAQQTLLAFSVGRRVETSDELKLKLTKHAESSPIESWDHCVRIFFLDIQMV